MKILICSGIMLILGFSSCEQTNDSFDPTPINKNLISNYSFENSGKSSLLGWNSNWPDTSKWVNYSNDIPIDGGIYSLKLANEWGVPGTVVTNIVPPIGIHRYRLSVWGKSIKINLSAGGDMYLSIRNGSTYHTRKYLHFSDTLWTQGEILDTLSISSTDTVEVKLRGNIDQFSNGYILFDLCRFEKVD